MRIGLPAMLAVAAAVCIITIPGNWEVTAGSLCAQAWALSLPAWEACSTSVPAMRRAALAPATALLAAGASASSAVAASAWRLMLATATTAWSQHEWAVTFLHAVKKAATAFRSGGLPLIPGTDVWMVPAAGCLAIIVLGKLFALGFASYKVRSCSISVYVYICAGDVGAASAFMQVHTTYHFAAMSMAHSSIP